jgi:ribonuclease D
MIKVLVTSNAATINEWVRDHAQPKCAIGLDIEWKPYGHQNRTAVLQIASASSILIARIFNHKELPSNLLNILEDRQVTKVGVSITDDLSKIDKDFKINCQVCPLVLNLKHSGELSLDS